MERPLWAGCSGNCQTFIVFPKMNLPKLTGTIVALLTEKDDLLEDRFLPAETRHIVNGGDISPVAAARMRVNLNDVPETPLLDTSANKNKAHLASSGALANRRPPSKGGALSVSSAVFSICKH